MLDLCEDYQSLLTLRSQSASNNLKIIKKLAVNQSLRNIPFTAYTSRSQFKDILNTLKHPTLFDVKTQLQIFLLCKKFRIDRTAFLESLCRDFLDREKTLALIPKDAYFELIAALNFYGVSDFEIEKKLIEQAISKLTEPEEFYELYMYLRQGKQTEQQLSLYELFQKITALGSIFKPQLLVNMLEIQTIQKEPILLGKLIQQAKLTARKFSAFQILRVMQLVEDLSILGVTLSQVTFEKERQASTKFFKNAGINIDLMERFYLCKQLNKNLGEIFEKHIMNSDINLLQVSHLTKFFIIHCLWFESVKQDDSYPWTPRQAKEFLKKHDTLVTHLLNLILARSQQLRPDSLFQIVQIYLQNGETHRRSIKRQLFDTLKVVSGRLDEVEVKNERIGIERKLNAVMRYCAINEEMRKEAQELMKER